MNTVLIILLILAVIWTVISLVRGIVAFLQSSRLDIDNPAESDRIHEMQLKQNRMMFARIKFQGLAVLIVVVLLMMNR